MELIAHLLIAVFVLVWTLPGLIMCDIFLRSTKVPIIVGIALAVVSLFTGLFTELVLEALRDGYGLLNTIGSKLGLSILNQKEEESGSPPQDN